jgi:hypothetical protein
MNSLVEFVDDLPPGPRPRPDKWKQIRASLAARPGQWARIDAKGGYPRQRLKDLGCEVRVVDGVTYARWPNG